MDLRHHDVLVNAAATIGVIYQWVDRINAAGGVTCIEGVAVANAMIASLNKNRKRTEDLIILPAVSAIEEMKKENVK